MSDHQWAVELAIEGFNEEGRNVDIIYNKPLDNSPDPDCVQIKTTIKALNVDFNSTTLQRRFGLSSDIVVQITGAYLINSACDPAPKPGMLLLDSADQIEYPILAVLKLQLGEQLIFYRVFTGG